MKGGRRSPAPIEAEGEFVQVRLEMLVSDRVVSPAQLSFQIPEDTVSSWVDLFGEFRLPLRAWTMPVS